MFVASMRVRFGPQLQVAGRVREQDVMSRLQTSGGEMS